MKEMKIIRNNKTVLGFSKGHEFKSQNAIDNKKYVTH